MEHISFYQLKRNINLILHKEGIKNKIEFLLTYLKIVWKYIFIVKLLNIQIKKEKFFGYTINFFSYSNFLYLFEEIFLLREYEFEGKIDSLIIDCGSNIGMSTLFFKKNYPAAKIICFEPDGRTFNLLKCNIEKNQLQNISLNEAAVYNKNGKIKFYSDADREGSLAMAITPYYIQQWGWRSKESIVKTIKLSDYINEPVDLLKIDIEGAEEKVIIELAQNNKLKLIKEMIIEYHYNKNDTENKLSKILTLLEKNNFKFIINSPLRPPYALYKNIPFFLLIYAYK